MIRARRGFPPPSERAHAAQVAMSKRGITSTKDQRKIDKKWVQI